MRETIHVDGKRAPDNPVHKKTDSPPRGLERHSTCNAVGDKNSHFHRASLVRAARGRGGDSGMARLGRGRAHRRAAIRARSGPDHRDHRSLFEKASTRRRVGIAEAARPRLSIQRLGIPPGPRIGSQPFDAVASATNLNLQGKGPPRRLVQLSSKMEWRTKKSSGTTSVR